MATTYNFNAGETIITPQEIVDFAPVDPNSYSEQRTPFIGMREEKLFRKCLGIDLYKVMMADKVVYTFGYTGCGTSYTHFTEGKNYVEDDVVLYKSRLYQCTTTTTGIQLPTDKGYWTLAPKFKTAAHNYLWERYLRTILAFSISSDSLFFRIISDEAVGVVQKQSDQFKPLSVKDAGRVRQEYQGDIDDLMGVMHEFIRENPDDYPDYAPLSEKNCDPCKINQPRHYGFNTRRKGT